MSCRSKVFWYECISNSFYDDNKPDDSVSFFIHPVRVGSGKYHIMFNNRKFLKGKVFKSMSSILTWCYKPENNRLIGENNNVKSN